MTTPAPIALGIDVGGTKTNLAIVDVTSGQILERRHLPTPAGEASGNEFLQRVETTARDLIEASSVGSVSVVGLGLCELVDRQGRIKSAHRVHWQELPVGKRLSRIAPAIVESDVRAAALAEARFGAGQPYENFLYLNIGTGVSTCWVANGRPHAGAHGHALVFASAASTVTCPHCGRRHDFVLEDVAGGAGLVRRYGEVAGIEVSGACEVVALAGKGDRIPAQVIGEAAAALGSALGMALSMLDPHALIIGGGLGISEGPYWDRLEAETRKHIWSAETRQLPILRAALGSDAGVIGAAMAAWMVQGISSPKLR